MMKYSSSGLETVDCAWTVLFVKKKIKKQSIIFFKNEGMGMIKEFMIVDFIVKNCVAIV